MKVLLGVHQFFPEFTQGTELLTLQTAKQLISRGANVLIYTGAVAPEPLQDGNRFHDYKFEGIRVRSYRHEHRPLGDQDCIAELEYDNHFVRDDFRRMLRSFAPDVVHFFNFQRLSASVIDACSEMKTPAVYSATDFWLACPTAQLLLPDRSFCAGPEPAGTNCIRHLAELRAPAAARLTLKLLPDWGIRTIASAPMNSHPRLKTLNAISRRAEFLRERMNRLDKVLAPTASMREILVRNGLQPSRVEIVGYGLDLRELAPAPPADSEQTVRLIFVGSLAEHKGAHVAVRAVRSLRADFPVSLTVYGDENAFPQYSAQLRREAAADSRIQFGGVFARHELRNILARAHALVVPSLWLENAPLVIYSAQAVQRCLIASRVAGISDAIQDGVNGLLFEPGNFQELARILRRVNEDRTLLQSLPAAAPPPRSIQQYVDDAERVYREVGAGARR